MVILFHEDSKCQRIPWKESKHLKCKNVLISIIMSFEMANDFDLLSTFNKYFPNIDNSHLMCIIEIFFLNILFVCLQIMRYLGLDLFTMAKSVATSKDLIEFSLSHLKVLVI